MKTLEDILLNPEGPFRREDGRALLALVETRLRSEQAAWLIQAIRPLEQELVDQIGHYQAVADQKRAAVAAAQAELRAAMAETQAAGINPPLRAVERRLKANQALAAAQQEAQSAGRDLQEAKTRQINLNRLIEALETFQPPYPGEVQEIVRRALSTPARLVTAVR